MASSFRPCLSPLLWLPGPLTPNLHKLLPGSALFGAFPPPTPPHACRGLSSLLSMGPNTDPGASPNLLQIYGREVYEFHQRCCSDSWCSPHSLQENQVETPVFHQVGRWNESLRGQEWTWLIRLGKSYFGRRKRQSRNERTAYSVSRLEA